MNNYFRRIFKAFRLASHAIYRRPLFMGVGAAIEHEAVLQRLNGDRVRRVVDIGANVGQFSLAVRRCIPTAKIDSFEPLLDPAVTYRKIFENDQYVTLHLCAIGPSEFTSEMHVSAAYDSSSLLPIGSGQEEIFPGTHEVGQESVRVAPLDKEIEPPERGDRALLKIDVQGYELLALQGCESFMDRFHAVYVEASFMELYEGQGMAYEVIDFLHNRGFALIGIYNTSYAVDGAAVQGDLLFGRRNE